MENMIRRMKRNNTLVEDKMASELFKFGRKIIIQELNKLITKIWEKEQIPERWTMGIIYPIFKKGDKLDCSNYRRIVDGSISFFSSILN